MKNIVKKFSQSLPVALLATTILSQASFASTSNNKAGIYSSVEEGYRDNPNYVDCDGYKGKQVCATFRLDSSNISQVYNDLINSSKAGIYSSAEAGYRDNPNYVDCDGYQGKQVCATFELNSNNIAQVYNDLTGSSSTNTTNTTNTSTASTSTKSGLSVTMQDLVDTVTKEHEVAPAPSIPSHWNFAVYGIPHTQNYAEKLNQEIDGNKSHVNPWNHIDVVKGKPKNAQVEMGPMTIAVYKDGKWLEQKFGAPCTAYTIKKGSMKPVVHDVAQCRDGMAYAGIGLHGWNAEDQHTHGWPKGWAPFSTNGMKYAMVWAPARMVKINNSKPAELDGGHYQYGIGIDKRNTTGEGDIITALLHGRRMLVGKDWKVFLGHTISPSKLKEMCKKGNLPPSLPLQGGCE